MKLLESVLFPDLSRRIYMPISGHKTCQRMRRVLPLIASAYDWSGDGTPATEVDIRKVIWGLYQLF
jgi:hypothetical protein